MKDDPSDRLYFDAKFDGIEKLMSLQESNLKSHISSVSGKADSIRESLEEHKEKTDAHGLGEGRRFTDSLAKWGSVILAAIAIVLGIRKHAP